MQKAENLKREVVRIRKENHKSTLENYQNNFHEQINQKNFRIQSKHGRAEEFKVNLTNQQDLLIKIKRETKKQKIQLAQSVATDHLESKKSRYDSLLQNKEQKIINLKEQEQKAIQEIQKMKVESFKQK